MRPEQPPGLEFEMTYRVRTADPVGPTAGSPYGARQTWRVAEASLEGPRISATLAAPGLDWMGVHDDGFWRPDVRAPFVTSDGAAVLLSYAGLVEQTERFKAAAERDEPTGWDEQYMRLAMRFETGEPRYAWLNTSVFVAMGRLEGTGRIEYAVYRLA